MTGHFITFEGGDGSGKTTLVEGVYETLKERGVDLIKTRAPGSTGPGKVLRQLLLHPDEPLVTRAELLLFLADRAQQVETILRPALAKGQLVLCDRYNDSTLAYQGHARGLDQAQVESLCTFATDALKPTLTFYLDIEPKLGLERVKEASGSKDQIEKEDLSFHETIRAAYLGMAKREPSRFIVIDASQTKKEVLKDVLKAIDDHSLAKAH